MKHYLSGIVIALSLALVLVLGVVALAENEPQAPELPAAGDLQTPAEAPEAAPATDDAQATQDNTALQAALEAYRAAKDSTREQALQDELDGYVAAGGPAYPGLRIKHTPTVVNILLLLAFLLMTAGLYITFFLQPVLVKVDEQGYAVGGPKPEGTRLELEALLEDDEIPDAKEETP